jgi:GTP-binding protein
MMSMQKEQQDQHKKAPRVAIIGKPNVGKSSLFNVLLGRRKSLVSDEAGVTRDVVESPFDLGENQAILLLDTGGISQFIQHDFIEDTIKFATKELNQAQVILFVIDFQTGITEDDERLIQKIRKTKADHTILVVNKVDNEKMENEAYEFHSVGFKDVVFISCAHKRGIESLKEKIIEKFEKLQVDLIEELKEEDENDSKKDDGVIRCALLGKPNVGKSSFFNKVIGRYRSIVSTIAGTTRDVIGESFVFKGKTIDIMDMAGFRRRPRIIEFIEKESVKKGLWALRKQDIIILLIDVSDHKVSEQDKKLVSLALKEKKALVIGLNKWDLIENNPKTQKMILERFEHDLHLASFVPIVPFSIESGKGLEHFLDMIIKVHKNYSQRITPREITLFLKEVIKQKPPFSKLGELKIYYGVQVSSKPPHFELFVNNPAIVTESYKKYLQKAIYEKYSLLGIPIFLNFKARH